MSVNKVILVGRLGQNPEVRYTPSGAAVTNFSLATNESWVDKAGQKQDRTEWHRIVVWGKQGENCGKYLTKGRQVYLEGRLQTQQWQDKDGNKRYTTEVVATTVQYLGGGAGAEAGARENLAPSNFEMDAGGGMNGVSSSTPPSNAGGTPPSFTEDDIPF